MSRIVIYTCITGDYDRLVDPSVVSPDFDYICFTDKPTNVKVWQIRPIPDELKGLSKVKQHKIVKISPHKYLPEYEESLYIDGSIDIVGDIHEFLSVYCSDTSKSIFIRKHPARDCIYDEAEECIRAKKDTREHIDNQIQRYKSEGFPKHFGLTENNIIYRRHDDCCKKVMEAWKDEIIKGSHRDQLSLYYCLWKVGQENFKVINLDLSHNPYFVWYKFHNR